MIELLYKLTNMWKKNSCFFWVAVLLVACEIPYITSVEGTQDVPWYQNVNYIYILLLALPVAIALGYIIVKRTYMPKARKGTRGIAFYIKNADEKQYEAIRKKFVAPFEKAINSETQEYSVVLIDDYHSQKYYSLLCSPNHADDRKKQIQILRRRRCCIAIMIDCMNGGDGEELFCHLSANLGIMHRAFDPMVKNLLAKDISAAFSPLCEVDIMKLTETSDLGRYSFSMDVICKYIMASTCIFCGEFLASAKLLEAINACTIARNDLPDAVRPICNVLAGRMAMCYIAQAEREYMQYFNDLDRSHLLTARNLIGNTYCKHIYEDDSKILDGICSFLLDQDVKYAMRCMNDCSKRSIVAKYNKVFLQLYAECTVKNIGRTYTLYKSFGALSDNVKREIENFTSFIYQKDEGKKQLLLILFLIYDHQGNSILAKHCLNLFVAAFPWVLQSEMQNVFQAFLEKY